LGINGEANKLICFVYSGNGWISFLFYFWVCIVTYIGAQYDCKFKIHFCKIKWFLSVYFRFFFFECAVCQWTRVVVLRYVFEHKLDFVCVKRWRPFYATAGGKDVSGLQAAIEKALSFLK